MKTNENGRSMVEMLGVLAIIGVLSIGGILGYTTAMNRHRANQIIDAAAKVSAIAQTSTSGTKSYGDIGLAASPEGTSNISTTFGEAARNVVITYTAANSDIENAVNSIAGAAYNATSNTITF